MSSVFARFLNIRKLDHQLFRREANGRLRSKMENEPSHALYFWTRKSRVALTVLPLLSRGETFLSKQNV